MWLRGGRGVCYSTDIDSDLGQYQIRAHAAGELADELEAAIRRGALRPGEELPSVRNMARELGISPTTVSAALAQLRARGLVATRERSKSFVAWRPPLESVWPLTSIPAGARDLASGNPDRELLPDLGAALRRARRRRARRHPPRPEPDGSRVRRGALPRASQGARSRTGPARGRGRSPRGDRRCTEADADRRPRPLGGGPLALQV